MCWVLFVAAVNLCCSLLLTEQSEILSVRFMTLSTTEMKLPHTDLQTSQRGHGRANHYLGDGCHFMMLENFLGYSAVSAEALFIHKWLRALNY